MRLLVTADLHFNHRASRPVAEKLIDEMNAAGGDAVLLVGDTAVTAGDTLEQCLSRFRIAGPKLFVAGNHELWTRDRDSRSIYHDELPRRLRALGWRWLEEEPFVTRSAAIVGSIGWYDYSFARAELGIPRRFYEHKISPGAADHLADYAFLMERSDDVSAEGRQTVARWNDGRFVHLGCSDEEFLQELIERLEAQLTRLTSADAPQRRIIVAMHHLPFAELLPPPQSHQWDFVKAYLGSARLGETLLRFEAVQQVFCGHSHLRREAQIGHIHALNIGSGYRWKTFETVDVPD